MVSSLVGVPSSPAPISGVFVRDSSSVQVSGPLTATFNFTDPGTNVSGSFTISGTIDATYTGIFAPQFCEGDGGDQLGCTDCPCGNNAPQGSLGGCLNGVDQSARLLPSGGVGIADANLRFDMTGGNPSTFAVLTSGASRAPANAVNPCFGLDSGVQAMSLDGLRCAVQSVQRHGARPMDANGDVGLTTNGWGPPNGPAGGLANQGGFVSGQTRHFQVIYREDDTLSCMRGQNTSNGVTVTFVP